MKMKYHKIFLEKYVETIIEILEVKQNYYFPHVFYLVQFSVFLLQLTSFSYNLDELKEDSKLKFIGLFSEYSSISYTLMQYGGDTLILTWFFFLSAIAYGIVTYLAIVSLLKTFFSRYYLKVQNIMSHINQKLHFIFTIYPWIFFLSFVEANSGILACGQNSFLSDYRDSSNCAQKPAYLYLFSLVTLILSLICCVVVFHFFRNRSFCEQNILRRRYNWTVLISTFLSFLVVLSYYLFDDASDQVKYYFSICVGAFYLYDCAFNLPFSDIDMNRYVAATSCLFFVSQVVFFIWQKYPNFIRKFDIFYTTIILSVVLCGAVLTTIKNRFDQFLKLKTIDLNQLKYQQSCCTLLEELYKLAVEYQNDKYFRFKLGELITFHKNECTFKECYCGEINIGRSNDKIVQEQIIKLIDNLFRQFLLNKDLQNNSSELERISLKYISFLSKCCNNSLKAYYMLKTLANDKKKRTYYFKVLQKTISQQLEEMIKEDTVVRKQNTQVMKSEINYEQENRKVSVQNIYQTDLLKQQMVSSLLTFLEEKKKFYSKLSSGHSTLSQYSQEAVKLGLCAEEVKSKLAYFFSERNKKALDFQNNAILLKLYSIYKSTVDKQLWVALQYEERFKEIMQKNRQRTLILSDIVSCFQENMEVIEVSLVQNKGQITSTNCQKIGQFFGYDGKEFKNKKLQLKDIMPRNIGSIHNELMERMVNRGFVKFDKSKISTYARSQAGYLIPVIVKLDVQQSVNDDFRMIGSVLKLNEAKHEIIMINHLGWIEGMTEGIHLKLLSQEEQNQVMRISHTKKQMQHQLSRTKSIKDGNFSNSQTNIFLILQDLLYHLKTHQEDRLKEKSSEKKVFNSQILYKQKYQLRVPKNIHRLNQKVHTIAKNRGDSEFYAKIEQYQYDISEEWLDDDSCQCIYNITFNLNFEVLNYCSDNLQKETQIYILEVLDVSTQTHKNDSLTYMKDCESSKKEQKNESKYNKDEEKAEKESSIQEGSEEQNTFNYEWEDKRVQNREEQDFPTSQRDFQRNMQRISDNNTNNNNSNLMINQSQSLPFYGSKVELYNNNINISNNNNYNDTFNQVDSLQQISEATDQKQSREFNYDNPHQNKYYQQPSYYYANSIEMQLNSTQRMMVENPEIHNLANASNYSDINQMIFSPNNNISSLSLQQADKYQHIPQSAQFMQSFNKDDGSPIEMNVTYSQRIPAKNKRQKGKQEDQIQKLIKDLKKDSSQQVSTKETSKRNIDEQTQTAIQPRTLHSTKIQQLEQHLTEAQEQNIELRHDIQLEINSNYSASSSQKIQQSSIYKLITTSFSSRIQVYMNCLIALSCLLIVSMVLTYSPQIKNVFTLIQTNIQYAYNTQHMDMYLSHQISNAMTIKLQNKTVQAQYSPYIPKNLYSDVVYVQSTYIWSYSNGGFSKMVDDSNTIDNWLITEKQIKNVQTVVFEEILMYHMYYMIKAKNQTNVFSFKVNNNDFNVLVNDFLIKKYVTYQSLQIQEDDIKGNISQITTYGTFYFILFIIQFVISLIIWLYIIYRFVHINRRILLLVARISWQECEVEQIKHEYCIQLLKSLNEFWVKKNFVEIIKYSPSDTQKLFQNKKQGKKGGQSILSSLIHDQSFYQWKFLLLAIIVSASGCIFFGATVLILNNNWYRIQDTINIYYKLAHQKQAQATISSFPDLLSATNIFAQQQHSFPSINIPSYYNEYQNAYNVLSSGLQEFTTDIVQLSMLSNDNRTAINTIFEQNICSIIKDSFKYCANNKNLINSQTTIGLAAVVQDQLTYLQPFQQLFNHTLETQDQTELQSIYFNSTQHQKYVSRGFDLILQSYHTLQSILYQSNQQNMNDIFNVLSLILSIITPITVIFWLAISVYLRHIILQNSQFLNFTLTCIPNSKLQDNITISMLKNLEQM